MISNIRMKFLFIGLLFTSSLLMSWSKEKEHQKFFSCFHKYTDSCQCNFKFRYDTQWGLKNENHNLKGHVKELVEYDFVLKDDSSIYHNKQVYNFDTSGNLLKRTSLSNQNKVATMEKYVYDNQGEIKTSLSYSDWDTIHFNSRITYKRIGNELIAESYGATDEKINTTTTEYDYRGYGTRVLFNAPYSNIHDTIFFMIDSKGQIDKEFEKSNKRNESAYSYIYDNDGNHVGFKNLKNDEVHMLESNFDKLGNKFQEDEKLEYDKNNNWVAKYKIKNGKQILLVKREIIYFD